MLPPKPTPEIIQWCALCMHLVGPCEFGNKKKPETHIKLHCLIMIDHATGCFEVFEIREKTANVIANWLEIHWLSRHPWPTEIAVDKGTEFAAEVSELLKND